MFKIGGNKIRHTKMCCRLVKHFFSRDKGSQNDQIVVAHFGEMSFFVTNFSTSHKIDQPKNYDDFQVESFK